MSSSAKEHVLLVDMIDDPDRGYKHYLVGSQVDSAPTFLVRCWSTRMSNGAEQHREVYTFKKTTTDRGIEQLLEERDRWRQNVVVRTTK